MDDEIDWMRHMSEQIEVKLFHDIDVLFSESFVEHAKIDVAILPRISPTSRSEENYAFRSSILDDPIHDRSSLGIDLR